MNFRLSQLVLAALFLYVQPVLGLPNKIHVIADKTIQTQDPKINEVYNFWVGYLNSTPDSSYNNPFWNADEKTRYPKADLFRSWYTKPSLYDAMNATSPKVLSITPEGEYFKITTLFSRQVMGGSSDSLAVTNIYAKKTGDKFALYNALQVNTKDWQHHTIGNITFICPPSHVFDQALATKLNNFVDSMALHFGQTPRHIDYYFADTYHELTKARGFDYLYGEGIVTHPQGYSEVHNDIVTASGSGEWYPHEFVHMYAATPYPSADVMLHEGLATYFGGSHSHSLDWMIVHSDSLIKARPDLDLNSLFNDPRDMALDYEIGSDYLFGGILTKIIYEKGGWNMVKKLMAYGPTPEQGRVAVLKDFFGVDQKDAGLFMKSMIAGYAKKISGEKLTSALQK